MIWRFIRVLLLLFLLVGILVGGSYLYYYFRSADFVEYATNLGLGEASSVRLSGTGSMYPTFPKGTGKTAKELSRETVALAIMYSYPSGIRLFNRTYFPYQLKRKDIVSFENAKTRQITLEQSGEEHEFLKRIYALPGDTIEFRDGIAYLNDEPQREPYIARARSTFGGEFITDCTKLTIPLGTVFVMGDNRKISADSRSELGLVSYSSINSVIPFEKQKGLYDRNYRETSQDLNESQKIKLDKFSLLKEINKIRAGSNFKPLTLNQKLEKSAAKRGDIILKYDDLSPEATRSGYTLAKAMKDVGYSNIVWSEFPLLGYYDNDEYLDALMEYPRLKKIFIDEDFQDIGIAEVDDVVNGCPHHVIVTQFGGYVPANYTATQLSSWKSVLSSLQEVYPGWKRLTASGAFYLKYKVDVDRILFLFDLRIKNISDIVNQMESNQWLTEDQKSYVSKDKEYRDEQEALSEKLNSAH